MPTPSNLARVDELLDDLETLLSRLGGTGLGIDATGLATRGSLNAARDNVSDARKYFDEHRAELDKNA